MDTAGTGAGAHPTMAAAAMPCQGRASISSQTISERRRVFTKIF
jgi:hypothetical protein